MGLPRAPRKACETGRDDAAPSMIKEKETRENT